MELKVSKKTITWYNVDDTLILNGIESFLLNKELSPHCSLLILNGIES